MYMNDDLRIHTFQAAPGRQLGSDEQDSVV
jgi:hypothetical protein